MSLLEISTGLRSPAWPELWTMTWKQLGNHWRHSFQACSAKMRDLLKGEKKNLQELMRDAVTLVDQAQQLINSQITQLMSSWIQFIKSALNFNKETCCGWVELFKFRALACQSCVSLPPNIWAPVWQKIQNQAQYWEPDISLSCPPQCVRVSQRLNRSQPVHCRLSPHKCYCLIVSLDFLGLKVSVLLNVLLV